MIVLIPVYKVDLSKIYLTLYIHFLLNCGIQRKIFVLLKAMGFQDITMNTRYYRGWTCKLISAIILINMPVIATIGSYIFLNKIKYYLQNGKSTCINKAKLHILKVLANKDSLKQIIPVILQFSFFGFSCAIPNIPSTLVIS